MLVCAGPAFEFLVLEVIPHFLVGVPIGRVFWQMEYVEAWLTGNVRLRPLGDMGWRLVHHDNQVTAFVVLKHLRQELDDFLGTDSFVVKSEEKLSSTRNRGHCRHTTALSSHTLFRSLSAGCPGLTQERCQRNVRLILEVEDRFVFPHCAAYS